MKQKLFALLLTTTFLSACSLYKIDGDEPTPVFFPSKTSPKEIVYFETANQPVELLGTVTVNTERRTPQAEVIEKAKREAAFIGGDAITNIREVPPNHKGLLKNAYIRTNYVADVVKLK